MITPYDVTNASLRPRSKENRMISRENPRLTSFGKPAIETVPFPHQPGNHDTHPFRFRVSKPDCLKILSPNDLGPNGYRNGCDFSAKKHERGPVPIPRTDLLDSADSEPPAPYIGHRSRRTARPSSSRYQVTGTEPSFPKKTHDVTDRHDTHQFLVSNLKIEFLLKPGHEHEQTYRIRRQSIQRLFKRKGLRWTSRFFRNQPYDPSLQGFHSGKHSNLNLLSRQAPKHTHPIHRKTPLSLPVFLNYGV